MHLQQVAGQPGGLGRRKAPRRGRHDAQQQRAAATLSACAPQFKRRPALLVQACRRQVVIRRGLHCLQWFSGHIWRASFIVSLQ